MKKVFVVVITLLLSAPAFAAQFATVENAVPDQYIVQFSPAAVEAADHAAGKGKGVAALAQQLAAQHGARVERVYTHALRGAALTITNPKRAEALARNPNVLLVEQDGYVSLDATQSNATWGLDRSDQRDLPLDSSYTYNTTASNVNAYIIDTGIRTSHNDFGGRARHGYDAVDGDSNASDCNGHGTHVAGTVGGSTWGIAKGVTLYGVRVLDCNGSGTTSGVIAGIDWVTQNHIAPAVANMSLGGGASSSLDTAVANSIAAGVTYAVAAGNDNKDACNYSPARVNEALTVGSTTSSDSRSSFSNWGTCVDIFAPGSSITSTWYTSDTATNTISGTSMASPHVAGAAALYLAGNPGASPSTVFQAILNSASQGKLSSIGSGSPNLLLYTLSGDDGGGDTGDTQLSNGVSVTVSGSSGSQKYFYLDVPSGASKLTVSISGGSGDADLYVKYGSKPTLSSYDCRPYKNGNNETCTFNSPAAGTWWIMLHGYSSYSSVSLTATHETSSCSGETYTGTLSGSGDSDVQPNGTYYYSSSGTHTGVLDGPSGTDFDLYLYKWNGSSWSEVARSISSTSHEEISYNGTSGYYYWRIKSYSGSGSYTFCLNRP
ncbi:MAG: S8 family peptidase [Acidobacteria bacterium]|nr:S8 family peptidase [Acidobacteriota bacterium]